MKLEQLEIIITKKIENYYGNVIKLQCEETLKCNGECSTTNFIILEGLEKNSSNELKHNKNLFNFDFNKRIGFSYINSTINLTFDENWDFEKLNNFLNKTINDKDLIEAINNRQIELNFHSLQERHCFKGYEIGKEEYIKEMAKHRMFKRELEIVLTRMNIDKNVCNFDIFM